jgi:hypothetical protein
MGYRFDGLCLIPGTGKKSSPQRPERLKGASSLIPNEFRCHFWGVKRPGLKDDQSSPCIVKVKNGGTIPPLHHTPSWRNN